MSSDSHFFPRILILDECLFPFQSLARLRTLGARKSPEGWKDRDYTAKIWQFGVVRRQLCERSICLTMEQSEHSITINFGHLRPVRSSKCLIECSFSTGGRSSSRFTAHLLFLAWNFSQFMNCKIRCNRLSSKITWRHPTGRLSFRDSWMIKGIGLWVLAYHTLKEE